MKKLLLIVVLLLASLIPHKASAAIAEVAYLDETVSSTASINIGAGTNRGIFIQFVCRGGSDITGLTAGGSAATKIEGITSATVASGDKFSLWAIAATSAGISGSVTLATSGGTCVTPIWNAVAFTGVNQTTPYNPSNPATMDFGSTLNPSLSITTQYTNSILVGGLSNNGNGVSAGPDTTLPIPNAYQMGYSTTNPLTVGSHALATTQTSTSAAVFLVAEIIADNGVLPVTATPAPLQNWIEQWWNII